MSLNIDVNAVSFAYQQDSPVLTDVSISFRTGATAIIGENGAGKTTLLKLLNGLLKPNQGKVLIGERDTRDYKASEVARSVGLVFQNPDDQIFQSRVLDEVMFGPLNIGMSRDLAEASARDALEELSMIHVVERNPYDLSYSDRKRICLAAVLAMKTDVILLDEPTISLDADGVRLVGRVIQRLSGEGKTVIAITHDMDFVGDLFHRVIVMANGSVLADGPTEHVFGMQEVLKQAHVSAPVVVDLGQAVGLSKTTTTLEDFASRFIRERLGVENLSCNFE